MDNSVIEVEHRVGIFPLRDVAFFVHVLDNRPRASTNTPAMAMTRRNNGYPRIPQPLLRTTRDTYLSTSNPSVEDLNPDLSQQLPIFQMKCDTIGGTR